MELIILVLYLVCRSGSHGTASSYKRHPDASLKENSRAERTSTGAVSSKGSISRTGQVLGNAQNPNKADMPDRLGTKTSTPKVGTPNRSSKVCRKKKHIEVLP